MKGNIEFTLSATVLVLLTAVYIFYELVATPAGGHPFGHFLGIVGSGLMVSTETLYSARKRWRFFRFGQVRHWLSFHIFTGIVGPALVLMHTGLAFRGLAGVTMLLTVIVVASGFLGRYIYTAVPRTMAGIEIGRRQLRDEAAHQRQELTLWASGKSRRVQELIGRETAAGQEDRDLPLLALLARRSQEWREGRRIRSAVRAVEREEQRRLVEIEELLRQHRRLTRQINSLRAARRALSWWHMLHVPLGLTLFSAMFIHIVAAIYFGGV